MSNCFQRFSYVKLRNVEISFVARLCTLSSKFWSLTLPLPRSFLSVRFIELKKKKMILFKFFFINSQ